MATFETTKSGVRLHWAKNPIDVRAAGPTAVTRVTWTFATQNFPGDPKFSQFIETATGGPDEAFASSLEVDISKALTEWSGAGNVGFQYQPDSKNVDIRIGFGILPRSQGALTDYHYDPTTGAFTPDTIIRIQDPSVLKIARHTDSASFNERGQLYFVGQQGTIEQVLIHEIGHALGLGHSPVPTAVMHSPAASDNEHVSSDDAKGIQAIYGPPRFDNPLVSLDGPPDDQNLAKLAFDTSAVDLVSLPGMSVADNTIPIAGSTGSVFSPMQPQVLPISDAG